MAEGVSIGNYKGVMLSNRPFGGTAGAFLHVTIALGQRGRHPLMFGRCLRLTRAVMLGAAAAPVPASGAPPIRVGRIPEPLHPRGYDPSQKERKVRVCLTPP